MIRKVLLATAFILVVACLFYVLVAINSNKFADPGFQKTVSSLSGTIPDSSSTTKRFVYDDKIFNGGASDNQVGYLYKGKIELTYPAKYQLSTGGCRNYYSQASKELYCVNIGGFRLENVGEGNYQSSLDIEFFDLNNENHRYEFGLEMSSHKVVKTETLKGVYYNTIKNFTEADTNEAQGYNTKALVYNTTAGPVGMRVTVWRINEKSEQELLELEGEIRNMIDSLTVTNLGFSSAQLNTKTGWNTYIGRDFAFNYPKDWVLSHYLKSNDGSMSIWIESGPVGLECMSEVSFTNKTIGGINKKVTYYTGIDSEMCSNEGSKYIFFEYTAKGKDYSFLFTYDAENKEPAENLFNQIIETLKISS